MGLTAFDILRKPEYQEMINLNQWSDFYNAMNQDYDVPSGLIGTITQMLLNADIDPLKFMNTVPSNYLYGTDVKNFEITNLNIERLNARAFSSCHNLKELDFSKTNLHSIGSNCFLNCTGLKEIRLPSTMRVISNTSFQNCKSLEKVCINCNKKDVIDIGWVYELPTECDIIFNDQTIKGLKN